MNNTTQIDAKLLEKVKQYVADNYIDGVDDEDSMCDPFLCENISDLEINYTTFEAPSRLKNIDTRMDDTWQESVFNLIDKKEYSDPEVYKRASISKQTFSKIRCDVYYQPNKDTAIQMCIGLKLNLDETLDLMEKAGYTLSRSIKRDIVVKYFIKEKIYKMDELNIALYNMNLKLFPIN